MGEPPLPARESFSYLGLSLSLTLLRVPPPSCPQRRRCTSSKETALDTRYERIIEIDRGRSWEKGRSRRNLVSRSTRFIDCSNYARALAGLKNPRSRSIFEYRRGPFLSVPERCHLLRAKFPSSSSLRDPPSPMRKRWNNGKISIDRG